MADDKKAPDEADPIELPFTAVAGPNADGSTDGSNDFPQVDHHIGPPASRKEIFSYYLYYAGNNGIGSFQ
jgi:hypothetical protein